MENGKPINIVPCLWFDDQAEEAASFYVSLFEHAQILQKTPYFVETPSNKPIGSTMTIDFELEGQRFIALNGGPYFTPNPSISFFANFDPSNNNKVADQLDRIWGLLSEGGEVLMELGEYPFSKKYGWVQDKFGISWQLILSDPKGEYRPFIVPSLLFSGNQTNKAEEAINFYTSVFEHSKIGTLAHYPEQTGPARKGALMFGDFKIEGSWLAAMDSGAEHDFNFSEGISLTIYCDSQEEIDYYWDRLSAVPEAEQCGWVKDKFGVSWQILPSIMNDLFNGKSGEKSDKVMKAMLQMKKPDIRKLQEAYNS